MIHEEFTPRRSWFMVITFVAFLAVAGFSLYFEFETSTAKNRIDELKLKKESLEKPTEEVKNNEIVLRASALAVKEQLRKIETEQLPWSKIIEKIESTVPKEKETNKPIVRFRSYNGSTEGRITVSATTQSGSPEPFADIASIIRAFAQEPSFKEVFVPSITKSLTPEGEIVLSFSINFNYQKPTF